jgi:hypothetical protein
VVGRQVVQTHAVFALALRHRARARVLPDLSDCGSLRRVRPSATRPRATRCGRHRSARGFFALDSKPSARIFSRTRKDASRALARTSAAKRSSC